MIFGRVPVPKPCVSGQRRGSGTQEASGTPCLWWLRQRKYTGLAFQLLVALKDSGRVSFWDWGIGTDLSEGAKSALGTSSTAWHTGLACSSSEPTAGTGEGQDVWIQVSKAHCGWVCSDFSPTKHLYPFLFPVSNKHHFMDSNLLYQCRMNFRRRRRLMELLTEKSRLVPESHDSPFCLRKQNHDNRKHTSFLSGDSSATLLSVEWLHGVLNVLWHPFCARGFTVNLKTVVYPCLQGVSQFTQSLALGVAFDVISIAPQLLISVREQAECVKIPASLK